MEQHTCQREYDFVLVLYGITELSPAIEDALFEAGCDDATLSVRYGRVHAEFSRSSTSLKDAIISAILDIRKASIGANVSHVAECNLVTQAEIARRIQKSRQHIHQLSTGVRGPGGFPAPSCHISPTLPLWSWCEVSSWLCENNMIRSDEVNDAEFINAINTALEVSQQRDRNPTLMEEVDQALKCCS